MVCNDVVMAELWYCLLHREPTDITPFLTSISPLLAGQIQYLELRRVPINSGAGVEVLVHSLTSPHSSLHKLKFCSDCTISSSDYHHLTTAIATSNLTHFTTDSTVSIMMSQQPRD